MTRAASSLQYQPPQPAAGKPFAAGSTQFEATLTAERGDLGMDTMKRSPDGLSLLDRSVPPQAGCNDAVILKLDGSGPTSTRFENSAYANFHDTADPLGSSVRR
jgi:hypothetical protein